jgi:hypothetical protein
VSDVRPPVARLGLPAVSDVAAQYRLHADCIANGEVPRPRHAVLVDIDASGQPVVYTFGMAEACSRERLNLIAAGISALGDAARAVNATSSN